MAPASAGAREALAAFLNRCAAPRACSTVQPSDTRRETRERQSQRGAGWSSARARQCLLRSVSAYALTPATRAAPPTSRPPRWGVLCGPAHRLVSASLA
jgi:hypothetical protein